MKTATDAHKLSPSPWVERWLPFAKADATLLDFACGSGRHTRLALERGYQVVAVDQDIAALDEIDTVGSMRALECDVEGDPWPFVLDEKFDVIIVTNYLFRARLALLVSQLAPNGLLLYETFALGNAKFGKPSNPKFLLRPGELLQLCEQHRLQVVGFEDGVRNEVNNPARIQRVAALKLQVNETLLPSPEDANEHLLLLK